jgi:tripartite-type tricarboxylate transporter receptor subunit TctC
VRLLTAWLVLSSGGVMAQEYPTRLIRIIVAQAPAAGADLVARMLAQKMTESWGQQVIVENRAGANGIIGGDAVAKSKPDGYTLLVGVSSAITMNPSWIDLISGHIVLMFTTTQGVAPHFATGKLRLLATCGERRTVAFPETPTLVESGYRGLVMTGWTGLLAPTGTPPEILNKLSREVGRHLASPEIRERMSSQGSEPAPSTPEAFAAFIKAEAAKWSKVIRAAGLEHSQ